MMGVYMKKILLIAGIVLLTAALAVGGWFGFEAYTVSKAPDVVKSTESLLDAILALPEPDKSETEEGKALVRAIQKSWSYESVRLTEQKGRDASVTVRLNTLDVESLYPGLAETAQEYLTKQVQEAKLASDVYNEEKSYKPELLEQAGKEAFYAALERGETRSCELSLDLRYEDGQWKLSNSERIHDALAKSMFSGDEVAAALCAAAVEDPEYVRKIYTIPEQAKAGPVPDPACFGSTTDPAEVEKLLSTEAARTLIGDQDLVWNPALPFLPDTQIHYYLDESILTIVWQEEEAKAVGTFAETFIADGSQLRRKIADDTFESFNHNYATEFSKQTNAVLALGGDLYHHDRACGIMVYEREIYRFEPNTSDTCYITPDGDMLFSYRGQFTDISQAEQFVKENDILYSICFGPVLIDDGKDVTPDTYAWGEINDNYARAALGMLGDKHYLSMNINCQQPGYYYLATLRQAADAMIERGCIKAYALDGGQTASTIIDHKLINPVQFGAERVTSDILYFATAVPNP